MRILVLFAAGLLMVLRGMTGQSPPEQGRYVFAKE